ncbi:MAG: magnesium/cobalt transporter CorA [Tissierellaceae bacterium]|nr:magnesium/cobalt transporter CorA [Tissierellaceae bacterium]
MEQTCKIIYTKYDMNNFYSEEIYDINKLDDFTQPGIEWIDIVRLNDEDYLKRIIERFKIHNLVLRDILNNDINPKIVDYDDYLFIVAKTTEFLDYELQTNRIFFILFKNKLISFRDTDLKLYTDFHESIKDHVSIRKNGPDDLLYYLLDVIVDNYFSTIEVIGEEINDLEDYLLDNPSKELLKSIYAIKRQLIYLRSLLFHMRTISGSLAKDEFDLIDGKTIYYLRDIHDQLVEIVDIVETYRDICSNLLDSYLSSIGNKTNEVMKVLTIFSTIFIPLTFLAGVYGMNFKYFPELNWKYSYAGFWLVSGIIIVLMIRYFKRKGWL